ncbi:uncharacterized protein ATNIH1004_009268 [Aspergillus tanneri]|uniref:Uncharacterized protein n=1 Tax=Aspergillus tanneri TaxID=1220188 RepID=A0A5M9MR67_9EURO|nr:uncharacterized protein ATNIH1004_009268 [Aspergillus tanneri]KAA8645057.1 hypothetical protein ATNIH1004_009268 [Aspergillus tanneri]
MPASEEHAWQELGLDQEISAEKVNSYRGAAKIRLQHFAFNRNIPDVRTIRESHIKALVNTFESEGCLRLNPDNFVKVLISDEILQQSLSRQSLSETDLFEPGEPHMLDLPENVKLPVLHGKHRLLAAERFLWDKWWIAHLYSDDLPPRTQEFIEEEHPNAHTYCDGDIYRNIRYHQRNGNVDSEIKWRAHLSEGSRRDLARMEKDFKRIKRGLDNLLPFVGLWKSLKLSYLGRWLSVLCPEELTRYLERLYRQCDNILGGYSPEILDPNTVTLLETLMPECSLHDRALIEEMMERRKIFPTLESPSDRQVILNRILRTSGRILSLHTFTRDFIYFEACSIALRKLLPHTSKRTVSSGFLHSYKGINQHPGLCRIQTEEASFNHHFGSSSINPNIGYRQLFLAVMRDFPVLSNLAPYRDVRKLKPGRHGTESESLFKLAKLAYELGFDTPQVKEIRDWAAPNQDHAVARDFLQQVRPPTWYVVDTKKAEDLTSYIGENLPAMARLRAAHGRPRFTTNLENLSKKFRCSRPSSKHYESDRKFLYIDVMYNYNPVPQAYATSLAIQRDIFVSYFGEYDLPPLSGEPVTEDRGSSNTARVNDHLLAGEWEPDQNTEYSSTDEYLPRGEDGLGSLVESGIRAEQASPSFVTASISTGSSAAAVRPETYDLDNLSDWAWDPHDTAMNEFHAVESRRPSSTVKQILSEDGLIVVYAWERKEYAKFSTSPQQRSVFEKFTGNLANQEQRFVLIREDRRVVGWAKTKAVGPGGTITTLDRPGPLQIH